MFDQFIEFIARHWLLSSAWLILLILLIRHESNRTGPALSSAEVTRLINKEDASVIDVRGKDEFRTGHLPGAINIPARELQKRSSELSHLKGKPIILICKTGTTAGSSAAVLLKAGFKNLNKLRGGIIEWQNSHLPLVKD